LLRSDWLLLATTASTSLLHYINLKGNMCPAARFESGSALDYRHLTAENPRVCPVGVNEAKTREPAGSVPF